MNSKLNTKNLVMSKAEKTYFNSHPEEILNFDSCCFIFDMFFTKQTQFVIPAPEPGPSIKTAMPQASRIFAIVYVFHGVLLDNIGAFMAHFGACLAYFGVVWDHFWSTKTPKNRILGQYEGFREQGGCVLLSLCRHRRFMFR